MIEFTKLGYRSSISTRYRSQFPELRCRDIRISKFRWHEASAKWGVHTYANMQTMDMSVVCIWKMASHVIFHVLHMILHTLLHIMCMKSHISHTTLEILHIILHILQMNMLFVHMQHFLFWHIVLHILSVKCYILHRFLHILIKWAICIICTIICRMCIMLLYGKYE